ncbi:hypothetical protein K493DRAFT_410941 [Basidiobolus meristosporus CBS 931.73]|uniref:Uncharacterized protein n=1 Tax=Basidiobolus meristosporus CBS 931.73 TaxID=1314790 RepID=A0A1Y1XS36_9FUNG|nr:hypothetical protein K493DRAFT_410941 [Basidiobolus meristosporus CBS 931.73]|eukprot:ORX88550.1 hypothetical protein K493DRAFT_410941 [Basidiobolus meristosporus CBS 931.73]
MAANILKNFKPFSLQQRISSALQVRQLQSASALFAAPKSEASSEPISIPAKTPGVNADFYKVYKSLFNRTVPKVHGLQPIRHSALNNLLMKVSSADEVLLLPQLLAQWRNQQYPIDVFSTRYLVKLCSKYNTPEVALTVFSDPATYHHFPASSNFADVMKSFKTKAVQAIEDGNEEEYVQHLDNMFRTFGIMPYYDLEHEASNFSLLIETCLHGDTKIGWERGRMTFSDYKHWAKHSKSEAKQLSEEAVNKLISAYEKRGHQDIVGKIVALRKKWATAAASQTQQ